MPLDDLSAPELTPDLLLGLDRPCPRYTSYPTADRFSADVGPADYEAALRGLSPDRPVSLYVHLPFCPSLCAYCGCTVVVSKSPDKRQRYLDAVRKEIDLVTEKAPGRLPVADIHLGGGTPNAFTLDELAELLEHIEARFDVLPDAARALEVDPRRAEPGEVAELGALGFDRISIGVQDFDPAVQTAIGRVQSVEETRAAIIEARRAGFRSINVDLIYGLPSQTRDGLPRPSTRSSCWRPIGSRCSASPTCPTCGRTSGRSR